jgi:hypothetical protein
MSIETNNLDTFIEKYDKILPSDWDRSDITNWLVYKVESLIDVKEFFDPTLYGMIDFDENAIGDKPYGLETYLDIEANDCVDCYWFNTEKERLQFIKDENINLLNN